MKKYFARLILKWCYPEVMNEIISEFFGKIPDSLKEPSLIFFADNQHLIERFFSIQAYKIQKKAIGEVAHSEFYNGMLAHIKSILAVASVSHVTNRPKVEIEDNEDEKKSLDDILSFRDSRKKPKIDK